MELVRALEAPAAFEARQRRRRTALARVRRVIVRVNEHVDVIIRALLRFRIHFCRHALQLDVPQRMR